MRKIHTKINKKEKINKNKKNKKIRQFCECGCGKPVAKPGNRYILGHNKGRVTYKPGQSGNKAGRPIGCTQKDKLSARLILATNSTALLERAIELALGSDRTMLKVLIERILPKAREEVKIKLPKVHDLESAREAQQILIAELSKGTVDTQNANCIMNAISKQRECIQVLDLEKELEELKARMEE